MKQKYDVMGMTCSACSAHVDKAVRHLDGVQDVNVNLLISGSLSHTHDKSQKVWLYGTKCTKSLSILSIFYDLFSDDFLHREFKTTFAADAFFKIA